MERSDSRAEYLPIPYIPITSVPPDSEIYDMSHEKRGKAYIFNHLNFDNSRRKDKLEQRTGTDKDRDRLHNILKQLGFEVVIFDDLTVKEVREELRLLSQADHSRCDCALIAVLSHGDKNRIEAYDSWYEMDELWKNFTADNCPSLAGKPKLLFIQACRGENRDQGTRICYAVTDGPSSSPDPVVGAFSSYKIPNQADFLIAFATTPEYAAWRNSDNGAWFVQALCQVLEDHGHVNNLLWMLTKVSRIVATQMESSSNFKQMPCVVSLLTRYVYFRPKNQTDVTDTTND